MRSLRFIPFLSSLILAGSILGCTANNQVLLPPPGSQPLPLALVVADNGSNEIAFFKPTDSGNVAPQKTISGASTQLSNITPVTRDAAGNVYVAQNHEPTPCTGTVLVFSSSASGDTAPTRVITGTNTTLDDSANGIAVDSAGNIYVSQDVSTGDLCSPPLLAGARITVFSPTANGNVAPVATIIGANTNLIEPDGLFADNAGHILVADTDAGNIYKFSTIGGATGNLNVAPVSTLNVVPPSGGVDPEGPLNVALDASGKIYVLAEDNSFVASIRIYPAGSAGSTSASATITGANTLMSSVNGILVSGGFIYVGNHDGLNLGVLIFNTTDNGNVAPTRRIGGVATTLTGPEGLSF